MAFSVGGSRAGAKADINVTPMIDVLLVLLIIFMIVVQSDSKGLDTRVPQPAQGEGSGTEVVITVRPDYSVEINHEAVPFGGLEARLQQVYRTRGNGVIFVRGEGDIDFEPVAQVIDVARGVGLTRVALMHE